MIRVAYLVRSLDMGGAERQLLALVHGLDRKAFAPCVVTYYPGGAFEPELRQTDVPLICLDKKGRWDLVGFSARLRQQLGALRPDILHGYMTTANLLGLQAQRSVPGMKLVWGVRQSSPMPVGFKVPGGRLLALGFELEQRLSRRPDLILTNSQTGASLFIMRGAPPERVRVVPNGIDTDHFRPDPAARSQIRQEWSVAEEVPLIGLVGRRDPTKGLDVFLKGAALAVKSNPDLRFVLIGSHRGTGDGELERLAQELGLDDRLIWAGERSDVPAAMSALDLHTSASLFGEGFSNAVAEAMAVGVPCVVTEVGDSPLIVGDCGGVVRPNDAEALARAWAQVLDQDPTARRDLAVRCRARIVTEFSLETMVARTESLYRELVGKSLTVPVTTAGAA